MLARNFGTVIGAGGLLLGLAMQAATTPSRELIAGIELLWLCSAVACMRSAGRTEGAARAIAVGTCLVLVLTMILLLVGASQLPAWTR